MKKSLLILAVLFAASGAWGTPQSNRTPSAKPSNNAKKPAKRVEATYRKKGQVGSKSAKTAAAGAAAAAATSVAVRADANPTHGAVPDLKSSAALVVDAVDGSTIYGKNTTQVSAIASITKLMTAMVVIDAGLSLDEPVRIERADIDMLKHTGSRLRVGVSFTRRDLLHLALMSSENRAASALGRSYPGGLDVFVSGMNAKAAALGMRNSRFVEPTGLSSENVSTPEDLARMVRASLDYPLIREFSTSPSAQVHTSDTGQVYGFANSNGLVRTPSWQIDVSKTGYISEAGQCLVMQARIRDRPVIIVLLDSWGKYTRIGDANRIKRWLEGASHVAGHASAS